MKRLNKNEFIDKNNKNTIDDDLNNIKTVINDIVKMKNLLEYAKKLFFEL